MGFVHLHCHTLYSLLGGQIRIQDLVVTAAITGSADAAFEAIRTDPLSPPSEEACRAMFDELLAAQSADLPVLA